MKDAPPRPDDLVLTQAQRVPPPDATSPEERDTAGDDAAYLADVRRLADRVGGLDRLAALVDELRRTRS